MAYLDLGEVDEAGPWIDRAAAAAAENPTPLRRAGWRRGEGSRGRPPGDAEGMRAHLERAVELAAESGQSAARCEALSQPRRGGIPTGSRAGRRRAARRRGTVGPRGDGARGGAAGASSVGGAGRRRPGARRARPRDTPRTRPSSPDRRWSALHAAMHEDLELDVLLPAAGRPPGDRGAGVGRAFGSTCRSSLAMIAQRTLDEDVRVRWFRGPVGREMTRARRTDRAAPDGGCRRSTATRSTGRTTALLRSLVQGKTNAEIAKDLGMDEDAVARRLGELFARIGRVLAGRGHRVRVPGTGPVKAMPWR